MATTLLYGKRTYYLDVPSNFLNRFTLIPHNEPAGKYTYQVWIEERTTWLSKTTWWCSSIVNANYREVSKNEVLIKYDTYLFRYFAFVAELVNYAHKFDYWRESSIFSSHNFAVSIFNFNLGDTFDNADFEVEVLFDDTFFRPCLRTFESFGVDIMRYNAYDKYKWKISKKYAKLYYGSECIYNHPRPMYVLAMLGWFLAPEAK